MVTLDDILINEATARLIALLPVDSARFEQVLRLQLSLTYLDGYTAGVQWAEKRALTIMTQAAREVSDAPLS